MFEDAFEKEELFLEEQHKRGELTTIEFNHAMRELRRDYMDEAHEAAQRAFDEELNRW